MRDASKGQTISDTVVGPATSSAGYQYCDIRDEYLTVVVGVNDKLDFNGLTATIPPGDYTPIGFAQALSGQIFIAGSSMKNVVSWGGQIVAGYNDSLDINDGAVKVATLNPGYYTMDALATEAQRALNAVSTNWTVTFSRATLKFTVSHSGGTVSLLVSGGVNGGKTGWTTLGFNFSNHISASSYVSDYQREEDRFVVSRVTALLSLDWDTGANGLAGTRTNCAELLGFMGQANTGAVETSYLGASPKGNREQACAASVAIEGSRHETTIEGTWIRDTATARELRNRLIAFTVYPQLTVNFSSMLVPDLERGRVIQLDAAFDSVLPYPRDGSDGTWAGKRFWVVSTRQHMGPDRWDTEVVCVEAN
jgi:hypothetical protein